MTTKNIVVALMLCTSLIAHAQVEQVAQQLAENEHNKFAGELPDAFEKGRVSLFGNARAVKKQFFLEENAETFADFLGWNKKKYSQKTIETVFNALSKQAQSGKISVKFDFPVQPTECIIEVQKDIKGAPKNAKKETAVNYRATTKANVQVEVSRQGVQTSIASNNVALIWEGRIKLVNGEVDEHKSEPPKLRSMMIGSVTVPSEPKEEQLRTRAKDLIEEYYRNLQLPAGRAAVLAPEIPNKADFENWLQNSSRIEIMGGYINVPILNAASGSIDVAIVPGVRIHVDPTPYLKENASQYSRIEAYHQLALTFTVDLQADKITKVVYEDRFIVPELASQPVSIIEPEPVVRSESVFQPVPVSRGNGEYYKVQILLRQSYLPLEELPQIFRRQNVTVEKYIDDGITYYKYVIPAKSISEAFAIRNEMVEKGIEDAWIAVYENEVRIRPFQGEPETVR